MSPVSPCQPAAPPQFPAISSGGERILHAVQPGMVATGALACGIVRCQCAKVRLPRGARHALCILSFGQAPAILPLRAVWLPVPNLQRKKVLAKVDKVPRHNPGRPGASSSQSCCPDIALPCRPFREALKAVHTPPAPISPRRLLLALPPAQIRPRPVPRRVQSRAASPARLG